MMNGKRYLIVRVSVADARQYLGIEVAPLGKVAVVGGASPMESLCGAIAEGDRRVDLFRAEEGGEGVLEFWYPRPAEYWQQPHVRARPEKVTTVYKRWHGCPFDRELDVDPADVPSYGRLRRALWKRTVQIEDCWREVIVRRGKVIGGREWVHRSEDFPQCWRCRTCGGYRCLNAGRDIHWYRR